MISGSYKGIPGTKAPPYSLMVFSASTQAWPGVIFHQQGKRQLPLPDRNSLMKVSCSSDVIVLAGITFAKVGRTVGISVFIGASVRVGYTVLIWDMVGVTS
jgi:hypothetical protein